MDGQDLVSRLRLGEGDEDGVTTLDLGDASFGNVRNNGVQRWEINDLLDGIRHSTTVENVEIEGDTIYRLTEEEGTALFAAIGALPRLHRLFVRGFVAPLNMLTCVLEQAMVLERLSLDQALLAGDGTAFAQAFRQLPSLTELRLSNMGFAGEFSFNQLVWSLASIPTLQHIVIDIEQGGTITPEALLALCQAPSLLELRLSPIGLDMEHVLAVSNALAETADSPTLELLELGSQGHEDQDSESWLALARMLEVNATLSCLTMVSFGVLDDDAIIAIAEALEENQSLQELRLSRCGDRVMGPLASSALAKMLRHNETLTELSMNSIGIEEEGVVAIAQALEQNTALQQLNLQQYVNVSHVGQLALLHMLRHNIVIEHIHPAVTQDDVRNEMEFWLDLNHSGLRGLELNINATDEQFIEALTGNQYDLNRVFYLLSTNPSFERLLASSD